MKRPEITDKIHDAISRMPYNIKVWIYGSEARGEARADSDVDLLILSQDDRFSVSKQQEIFKPLYNIELETGVQINPIFETESNWSKRKSLFTINVNRERVAL